MSLQMKDDPSGEEEGNKLSLKLLVLGDSKIGKTSILERYVNKTFKDNYLVTIVMDIRIKRLQINNNNLNIHITDTAGQERFRSISKMQYNRTHGILIGFALNDRKTFESITYWVEQIYTNRGNNSEIGLVLFGNKCDDKENIEVTDEEINDIKTKYKLQYFSTSAKENIDVQNLFEYLIKETLAKKGLLKNFGIKDNTPFDEIIINEREKENIRHKKPAPKKKKKSFC